MIFVFYSVFFNLYIQKKGESYSRLYVSYSFFLIYYIFCLLSHIMNFSLSALLNFYIIANKHCTFYLYFRVCSTRFAMLFSGEIKFQKTSEV